MRREIALCIGPAIRKRRERLKLSQRELAVRVRSGRPIVTRIEASWHAPTMETLERYARALCCLPSDILLDAELIAQRGSL